MKNIHVEVQTEGVCRSSEVYNSSDSDWGKCCWLDSNSETWRSDWAFNVYQKRNKI